MKLSDIPKYNKAIHAFIVSAVSLSALLGLDLNLNAAQIVAISATLTAIAVWAAPNAK